MRPKYLDKSFTDSEFTEADGSTIRLRQLTLGQLRIVSGELVACDPLVFPATSPYNLIMPIGEYPVIVTVAHMDTDQRVAFARVQFRDDRVEAWAPLTVDDQDLESLREDEYFGYPVDSGTGCFMDSVSAQSLDERMRKDDRYFQHIIDQMEKNYVQTWDWANIQAGDATNIICFSTGWGDGIYPSFVGRSREGKLVSVLTDFMVFEGGSSTSRRSGCLTRVAADPPSRFLH